MNAVHTLRPVVILGPTAGGKSELAVRLAEALGGQVIGADSMQVYRHMDAGTAKPSAELRRRIKHHLIDVVEPTERFTVADWLVRAQMLIANLTTRRIRPIVVGGTNLYIKALLEGLFDGPTHDPALRAQLGSVPSQQLHDRLVAVDPTAASRIHPNDHRKLVRALEVHQLSGQRISRWQTQWHTSPTPRSPVSASTDPTQRVAEASQPIVYRHNPVLIGLDWPRDAINRRINQRVKQMFFPEGSAAGRDGDEPGPVTGRMGVASDSGDPWGGSGGDSGGGGLVGEVTRLLSAGILGPQARQAIGYKQVVDHVQGRAPLAEAFEKTKIATRRYAKCQRTWLRRYRGVKWLHADGCEVRELTEISLDHVRQEEGPP